MSQISSPEAVLGDLRGSADSQPHELGQMLWELAQYYATAEWDVPDHLYAVERNPRGELVPSLALHKIPIHPVDAMRQLASGLKMAENRLPMRWHEVVAWLLVSEGWMLEGLDASELLDVAGARQIHKHPQRVEVRTFAMADRAGVRYQIVCPRGGAPIMAVSDPTCVNPASDIALSGDIPQALTELMEATPLS